jgi:hypothetical protein
MQTHNFTQKDATISYREPIIENYIKKHLEEVKENFKIKKTPLCIFLSLYKSCRLHNIHVQTPHKVQKKGLEILPNALENQTPYVDA